MVVVSVGWVAASVVEAMSMVLAVVPCLLSNAQRMLPFRHLHVCSHLGGGPEATGPNYNAGL